MNYANFCAVLARIEAHPEQLNQSYPMIDDCPCCLLGHAKRIGGFDSHVSSFDAGCKFFSMDLDLAEWLWHPDRTLDDFRRVRLVAGYANFPKAA